MQEMGIYERHTVRAGKLFLDRCSLVTGVREAAMAQKCHASSVYELMFSYRWYLIGFGSSMCGVGRKRYAY